MPKKPRKKPEKPPVSDVTMLQKIPRSPGGHNAKKSPTRRKFLHAFESTCGNITASCKLAGISRLTYYRWMESSTEVNLKFQESIKKLRAPELLKDLAEGVLIAHLNKGNLDAAKFVLERKAKERGYANRTETKGDFDQVIKAVERLQNIVEIQTARNPNWKFDLRAFAEIAADDFKVPVEAIEKEYLKRQPQHLEGIQ